MTVLMAGCGDLGTEAGLRFAAAGHRVVGWRRSAEKLPGEIEGVSADLTSANLPPASSDTSAVVIAVAAESSAEAAYRAAYVDGLANVLRALDRDDVRPRRVLFVSSTAVYGDADGGWVTEDTTPAPGGFSGRIILEAEELLHRHFEGTDTDTVVLRLGGIYGPGRTRLIDQVRSGSAATPAEARYTNRIHRDDAAAAIVHLCSMEGTPHPAYLGVDNHPAEMGEVLRFLAEELGLPHPPAAPREPEASAGQAGRGGNKRCSNQRLRDTGFEFSYPTYREGYRAILEGKGVRHP
ncbi:SDR family oxidoreductase [Arthrobacter rhizosphaerae]|uniref:SDR family oxidoreductase n=1 Tax=Arthrobacter rhizosphaerae TaxID=2855490 RepID=UPI001FF321C5|nr:SDR family oxidoreductase [Arthrobacter rhizosphaerae]